MYVFMTLHQFFMQPKFKYFTVRFCNDFEVYRMAVVFLFVYISNAHQPTCPLTFFPFLVFTYTVQIYFPVLDMIFVSNLQIDLFLFGSRNSATDLHINGMIFYFYFTGKKFKLIFNHSINSFVTTYKKGLKSNVRNKRKQTLFFTYSINI